MNTNLTNPTRTHPNPYIQESKEEGDQHFLKEIEQRIKKYLCDHQEQMDPGFIEFHQGVLKRCKWSIRNYEILPPELREQLESFSKQDLSQSIDEVISWIDLVSYQPSLEFFNKKFNDAQESSLRDPSKRGKRIKKYLTRTASLLKSSNERDPAIGKSYSDSEIREYVNILVKFSRDLTLDLSKQIEPLIEYLRCTEYSQFSVVMQSALDERGKLGTYFTKTLIPVSLGDLGSEKGVQEANIERGLEVCLENCSHECNDHFVDIIFDLLGDKKNNGFINKVFHNMCSIELLDFRVRKLLEKIICDTSEKQFLKIEHIMRFILNNQLLLSRLHYTHPLAAEEKERWVPLILNTYRLNELPPSIKERINSQVFNPFLYEIGQFIQMVEGDVQESILAIFLNIIEHEGQNLIEEFRKSHHRLNGVSQLFKMVLGRFHSGEILGGKSLKFLTTIVFYLTGMSRIRGPISKKFEIVERVLNTFLEVKLDHLGILIQKNAIQKFNQEIFAVFGCIETFEDLEQKVQLFERSFVHLLFAQLYSDDDFKEWFRVENPQIQPERMGNILDTMESQRASIQRDYGLILKENGFEYIHNNQIGALATLKACINQKNLFLKLGTGQGKSLIAEMSAIHLLRSSEPPERVFIFTSYDHLAKRDYQEMKFLSEASGYPSVYISEQTSYRTNREVIKAAKILHIHSDTFLSFLSRSVGEALDAHEDISDLVKLFFRQQKCAVILDEGDLMIMDDNRFGRIHTFEQTFGKSSINMSTQREQFDDIVGEKLIQSLNRAFPGCYNQWYRSVLEADEGERSATHEASGLTNRLAKSFSRRIQEGCYQFSPFSFTFSGYVRAFRQVLFLSGSIEKDHSEAFEEFFYGPDGENKKKNLFVNIPFFFGPHNRANFLKTKKTHGNLREEEWQIQIEIDLEEAMDRGQPILLFGCNEDLENIKSRLRENSKISSAHWITITDEHTLEEHGKRIGERHSITFATTICGRGIDIKISKDIESGLHVLITKLPDNNNKRLLTQMIGRTARLDRNGSVSMIVKEDLDSFEMKAEESTRKKLIDDRKFRISEKKRHLSVYFLSRLKSFCESGRLYSHKAVKRWVVLLEIINHNHIDLLDASVLKEVKEFIVDGI